jgi:hypothetical protein
MTLATTILNMNAPPSTLPPLNKLTHTKSYSLDAPRHTMYSSIEVAQILLGTFPGITNDRLTLVEHILRSLCKFRSHRPYASGSFLTELSWSALERMNDDLVTLAHRCGVCLRNEMWKGKKIDLRELYNRIIEKLAEEVLGRRVSIVCFVECAAFLLTLESA